MLMAVYNIHRRRREIRHAGGTGGTSHAELITSRRSFGWLPMREDTVSVSV